MWSKKESVFSGWSGTLKLMSRPFEMFYFLYMFFLLSGVWFWVAVRYGVLDLIVLDGFAVFIVSLGIPFTLAHALSALEYPGLNQGVLGMGIHENGAVEIMFSFFCYGLVFFFVIGSQNRCMVCIVKFFCG